MPVIIKGTTDMVQRSKGARVELLLQVSDLHLYFLVKFHDLICY